MASGILEFISRSLVSLGLVAAVAGLSWDGNARDDARPTDLAHEAPRAIFGVVNARGALSPSSRVALRVGQQFGWQARATDDSAHRWREVLITPSPPREWRGDNLIVAGCGRVGITERTDVAMGGLLTHTWSISPGDPLGPHELRLYLDGRLVDVFHFETVMEAVTDP